MDRLSVRLNEQEFSDLDNLSGLNRTEKVKTAIKIAKKFNKKKGLKNGTKQTTLDS